MIVAELIEQLSALDPDLPVWAYSTHEHMFTGDVQTIAREQLGDPSGPGCVITLGRWDHPQYVVAET